MKALYFLLFTFLILSCESENDSEMLIDAKSTILSLAKKDSCVENAECLFIGLGSKPCGGPWEYLIYSTQIDTSELHRLVHSYNNIEMELNKKSGAISDCSIPAAPDSIKCENGCVAYYQGKAYKENVCCN
jgi:hypothetical protein